LIDQRGQLIDSEGDDQLCIQMVVTRELRPGETIRDDDVVALNGKLLKNNETYKLRYKYFGFEAETKFTVRVVM
jgi:hypothetical protein